MRHHVRLALGALAFVACTGPSGPEGPPPGGDGTPSPGDGSSPDASSLPADGGDFPADGGSAGRDDAAGGGSTDASSSPDGGAPEELLGTVRALSTPCDPGSLPGTTCTQLEVACPSLAPIEVMVRDTAPTSSSPAGTIVFGLGGGGDAWFESTATARAMLSALSGDGYRVVQRAWVGAKWESGSAGMRASACRYATLLTWIHAERHASGAFCATGNSGGSAEIAYALAHYDRGSILQFAAPTGGPPMARIDRGCLDGDDPSWNAWCESVEAGETECANVACTYAEDGSAALDNIDAAYAPAEPCDDADEGSRDTLLASSVLAPDAVLSYPGTIVHFLYGAQDCTGGVTQGLLYVDAVRSRKRVTFVPDTRHNVSGSPAGASALRDALLEGCVAR